MAYNWREAAKELDETSRSVNEGLSRQRQAMQRANSEQEQSASSGEQKGGGKKEKPQPKPRESSSEGGGAIPTYGSGAGLGPITTGSNSASARNSTGGREASVGGWWTPDRISHAYNYLKTEGGLSDHGAAGLVARWAGIESSKDGPTSVNSIGATGIAQWLGSRKNGISANSSFDQQLAHVVKELNSSEGAAARVLRSASSPAEGSRGASMFERAEGYSGRTGRDNFTDRTPTARIYNMVTQGAAVPASTTPSTRQQDAGSKAMGPRAEAAPQRFAADASSMSDASNDIRRAIPASASGTTQVATNATPASTTPSSTTPAASPTAIPLEATGKMPTVALPAGVHYQQFGDGENAKFILIDDKSKAPVSNLSGYPSVSAPAKTVMDAKSPLTDKPGETRTTTPVAETPQTPTASSAPAAPASTTTAPTTAPATAPGTQPAQQQNPWDNPLDAIGGFLGDLFGVPDNLKQNGQEWDPLYGYQTPPKEGVTSAGNQQAATPNAATQPGLFDGFLETPSAQQPAAQTPEMETQAAQQPTPPSPDNASADGGGDFGSTLDSIFGGGQSLGGAIGGALGLARGGLVPSFSSGGFVTKENTGRADRVASAIPGVDVGTDKGLRPGGSYTARRGVFPGYSSGGYHPGEEEQLGPKTPPVVENPPAAPVEPQQPPAVNIPTTTASDDRGWNVGYKPPANPGHDMMPGGFDWREAEHQRHRQEQREDSDWAIQNQNSYTFGGMIRNALHGVVTNVSSEYGLDKAAAQSQGQGVPTNGQDPFSDIANFFTGDHSAEAISPEQMNKITKKVDPYGQLKEGLDKTAALASTYKFYVEKGDIETANKAATAMVWHLQGLSAQYGASAYAYLKAGNDEAAIKLLEKGYNNIPDGMSVRVAKQKDGTYNIEQYDITTGKTARTFTAGPADMLAASLGLKNGTAFWEAVTTAAQNKRTGGSSQSFGEFERNAYQTSGAALPAPGGGGGPPPEPEPRSETDPIVKSDNSPDQTPSAPKIASAIPPAPTADGPTPIQVANELAPKNPQSSADFLVQRQKALMARRSGDQGAQLAVDGSSRSDAPEDVRGRIPAPPGSDPRRLQNPTPYNPEADIKTLKGPGGNPSSDDPRLQKPFKSSADARQASEARMQENDTKYSQAIEEGKVQEAIPWNAPRAYTPPSDNELHQRYLDAENKRLPGAPKLKPLYNYPDVSNMSSEEGKRAYAMVEKLNAGIKAQNAATLQSYNNERKAATKRADDNFKLYDDQRKDYTAGVEKTNPVVPMTGGTMNMGNYPGGAGERSTMEILKAKTSNLPEEMHGPIEQLSTWGLQHNPGVPPERVVDTIIKALKPVEAHQGVQTTKNMQPAQVVPLGDKLNRYKIIPSDPTASPIVVPGDALPLLGTLRAQMFRQRTMVPLENVHKAERSSRNWAPIKNFFGMQ